MEEVADTIEDLVEEVADTIDVVGKIADKIEEVNVKDDVEEAGEVGGKADKIEDVVEKTTD